MYKFVFPYYVHVLYIHI